MILPIYIYGHPVLRQPCLPIDSSYNNLDQLIDNMFETMQNANGIGISAPQVGLSIRLFLVDLTLYDDPNIPCIKKVFINPEITEEFGELETQNEGCLSIPGIRSDVIRRNKIKVKYYDKQFKLIFDELDGLYARVYQHEYDHLNGVLFFDHLTPLDKNIVNRKLKPILKGKFEELYPVIKN